MAANGFWPRYTLAAGTALTLGIAWWLPGTVLGALLTWAAAAGFIFLARGQNPLRWLFLTGILLHPIAFYWLFGTIREFGHFPLWAASAIFALFVVGSSIQFVFFGLGYKHLPSALDRFALRAPLAWITAEFIALRIFPWNLGHTQIAFLPFVQIADLFGSIAVSFLLIWLLEALLLLPRLKIGLAASGTAAAASILYGYIQLNHFNQPGETEIRVALVQGNISLEQKHDEQAYMKNVALYRALSQPFAREDTLVIWPETAVMAWVHNRTGSRRNDPRLDSLLPRGTSLLFGSLSFLSEERIYNSSFALSPDGALSEPFTKRILMPFGEYTPFGETLPFLREINATAPQFEAGRTAKVFPLPVRSAEGEVPVIVGVSPLICYEDVVQYQAREAVLLGADLLVNQTNDAWFGPTAAPYQHHLIASFRAIENRRFLLRSTNTGLTAVVAPTGKTISQLPIFAEGVLEESVWLPEENSLFTSIFGNRVIALLVLFTACLLVLKQAINVKKRIK